MKDTAQFGTLQTFLVDAIFNKQQRAELFRTWGSIREMLPKGGNQIWNSNINANSSLGDSIIYIEGEANITANDIIPFFHKAIPSNTIPYFFKALSKDHSFGLAKEIKEEHLTNQKYWSNPLETQLPNAPNLTIYCLYGVGKETEYGYVYKNTNDSSLPYIINNTINIFEKNLVNGVQLGNGDGTVPLISLGFMCAKGWKLKKFNPHNVKIVTREYKHEPLPVLQDIRGGPKSGDHVDICMYFYGNNLLIMETVGNTNAIEDILRIASGLDVEERIVSNIVELSENIKI